PAFCGSASSHLSKFWKGSPASATPAFTRHAPRSAFVCSSRTTTDLNATRPALFPIPFKFECCPIVTQCPSLLAYHRGLRGAQRHGRRLMQAEQIIVKVFHQLRSSLIVYLPRSGKNTPCTRLQESLAQTKHT